MLTSSESNISANFRDGIAAQYLAEAGVQHAIVKLKTDTSFVTATQVSTIAAANTLNSSAAKNSGATAGSYTVTVTGAGNVRKIISTGTVNTSIMPAREVFIQALKYEAVNIILIHNHPSGDPSPSAEDIRVSKRMKEAGNFVGITLMDHIIIGDNRYISLKEQGLF
jgi:hypothetical protein